MAVRSRTIAYRRYNTVPLIELPSMINPKILVTGATGKTGGAVVRELLAKGVPVRAMVRTLDLRRAALEARGAEVVVADIFDPGQLMDAMRDVQRAYYCPPYHPFVIQSASAFAAAAREWLAGSHGIEGSVVVQSPLKEAFA
jgi:uncharacterized protein YbjT (DUF2867 family)